MSSIILSQPGVAHPSAIVGAKAFYWSNAPGFDPLSLSPSFFLNMAANADANDTAYNTAVDSSGNGRNYTAGSTNMLVKTGVQNGNRIVRFPGGATNEYFRLTDGTTIIPAAAFFALLVVKVTTFSAGAQPYDDAAILSDASGVVAIGYNRDTPIAGTLVNDGVGNNVANATVDTAFHIWMTRLDAGTLYFSVDNGTEGTQATGNISGANNVTRIGANYNSGAQFVGDLGVIYICPTVPSLANRTAAFNYFKSAWATP